MSEIHDSPGWHTGAYTGCISVPAVIGKILAYLSLQAKKSAADKFDTYNVCISVFCELSVPVGTEVHPALSQITILVQPDHAMAVSGYRYGRISRHVSRKAWLCKGSKILPFLLICSIRLKTNSFVSTSGF